MGVNTRNKQGADSEGDRGYTSYPKILMQLIPY